MTRLEALERLAVDEDTLRSAKNNIQLINDIFNDVVDSDSAASAINESKIIDMMMDDLEDEHGYNYPDSSVWVCGHGEAVISSMWDAYSKYMEENT